MSATSGALETSSGAVPELQSDHSPAGGDLPRAGPSIMRLSEGSPVRLGATWDGRGTNFALFSAHAREGRALPVRQPGPARDRPRGVAGADRGRLARLPRRRDARTSFMAIACTAPTIPRRATASMPTSCCSILTPSGSPGGSSGATRISATARAARGRISRSTGATTRAACRRRWSRTRPSTGNGASRGRASRGKTRSSTKRT